MALAGFRLAAPSEFVTGPALVGRPVLFYWPTDGWVRETVARRSRAVGHSHVVRYDRRSALGGVWALLWLIRSSMPLRTAPGDGSVWVGAALPCALALAPRFSRPTFTAFRAGQANRAERERTITMVNAHETVASTGLENSHNGDAPSARPSRVSPGWPSGP